MRKLDEGMHEMAKSFSRMTKTERRVNRDRLRAGLPADFTEEQAMASARAAAVLFDLLTALKLSADLCDLLGIEY